VVVGGSNPAEGKTRRIDRPDDDVVREKRAGVFREGRIGQTSRDCPGGANRGGPRQGEKGRPVLPSGGPRGSIGREKGPACLVVRLGGGEEKAGVETGGGVRDRRGKMIRRREVLVEIGDLSR